MPGQRTKFSEVWLTAKDCNGDTVSDWCKKGKDDFHGYCCVCKIDLKCDNGGKVQLLKHCSNQKHQEAMRHTKDTKQTKLIFDEVFMLFSNGKQTKKYTSNFISKISN